MDNITRDMLYGPAHRPGTIVETVRVKSYDGWTVPGEFRVLVDREAGLIMVENTRVGLGRFGPWRYALSRQGMDAAARRYLPGARYASADWQHQSGNPVNDTWRRVYRAL